VLVSILDGLSSGKIGTSGPIVPAIMKNYVRLKAQILLSKIKIILKTKGIFTTFMKWIEMKLPSGKF
jgi:hypothetical protein